MTGTSRAQRIHWRNVVNAFDPRTCSRRYTVHLMNLSGGRFKSFWMYGSARRFFAHAVRTRAALFITLDDEFFGEQIDRADLSNGRREIIDVSGRIVGITEGS